LLLIIAAAFGLGTALQNTGAAAKIADLLVSIFEPAGKIGILFGLYLATAIMSSVISNSATVTLMFPIGWSFVTNKYAKCQTISSHDWLDHKLMLCCACWMMVDDGG
jgi:di/tricarboxylate transporter